MITMNSGTFSEKPRSELTSSQVPVLSLMSYQLSIESGSRRHLEDFSV